MFAQTSGTELGMAGVLLTLIGVAVGWFMRVFVPSQQQAAAAAEARTATFITAILDKQDKILAERDSLIKLLMVDDKVEREKDRELRHNLANQFQVALTEVNRQHLADAEKDRAAFMERQRGVEIAIATQTQQLQAALGNVCRFRPKES